MPIRLQQLEARLAEAIAPIYLLAGAEPLLVQEARERVVEAATERGFSERQFIQVDRSFSWDADLTAAAAPGLFAARRILDVRMPGCKPGVDGARVLTAWADKPDPDNLLLLSFGNWDAASRKTKWARAVDKAGVLVEIWPLKPRELPGWIRQRMAAAGLKAGPEAVAMLSELVEGNLLAAQQEIDKLALAGNDQPLTARDIEGAVAASARFDAFRLAECALEGNAAECLRVSSGLFRNHVAIQPVAAALYRELALADALREATDSGHGERAFFTRMAVWDARQGPMRAASRRLSARDMGRAFRGLSLIDLQGKGRAAGDPWQTLDRLLLFLCNPRGNSAPAAA